MAVSRGAAKLREYLADPEKVVVCPGVLDGLTARVALSVGFDALYMTGAGTAISRLGQPDLGLTTVDDMATNAGMIAGLDRSVPVIADADTGFGSPLMVARTVEKYMLQGVAAFHIEDQVTTKRCGHLLGKELVDTSVYVARIRAAAAARAAMPGSDIVIIARTDSLQSLGYDAAVERLKAAVAAGADVAFLEGMTTKEQMAQVVKDMAPTPCFLNMVSGGVTPLVDAAEAKALGYKIVIWPMACMTSVYLGMRDICRELKGTGRIEEKYEDGKLVGGVREVFECAGLSKCSAFDAEMGGTSFKNGA
ncbi:Phosphoenolpyruvate/pyruvate domain-containing protein [Microdochium trichocladiopsis]|uniref:Phosphoenolpyruvate/pyruvate domain-containing protein n=1 Tax=Microdochium trichocladiopsis TaxID=1682393 RepID=A0A9P8YIK9_9PEZI|nr:Phosphoenolpyruvate/pyruvate domain-containing protein [Microdochium trichocladiopsis]KAH7041044.1 Phosphoenolpyruvate/pyruvate domain-containing protein [Microdochium trichocladiopsis]